MLTRFKNNYLEFLHSGGRRQNQRIFGLAAAFCAVLAATAWLKRFLSSRRANRIRSIVDRSITICSESIPANATSISKEGHAVIEYKRVEKSRNLPGYFTNVKKGSSERTLTNAKSSNKVVRHRKGWTSESLNAFEEKCDLFRDDAFERLAMVDVLREQLISKLFACCPDSEPQFVLVDGFSFAQINEPENKRGGITVKEKIDRVLAQSCCLGRREYEKRLNKMERVRNVTAVLATDLWSCAHPRAAPTISKGDDGLRVPVRLEPKDLPADEKKPSAQQSKKDDTNNTSDSSNSASVVKCPTMITVGGQRVPSPNFSGDWVHFKTEGSYKTFVESMHLSGMSRALVTFFNDRVSAVSALGFYEMWKCKQTADGVFQNRVAFTDMDILMCEPRWQIIDLQECAQRQIFDRTKKSADKNSSQIIDSGSCAALQVVVETGLGLGFAIWDADGAGFSTYFRNDTIYRWRPPSNVTTRSSTSTDNKEGGKITTSANSNTAEAVTIGNANISNDTTSSCSNEEADIAGKKDGSSAGKEDGEKKDEQQQPPEEAVVVQVKYSIFSRNKDVMVTEIQFLRSNGEYVPDAYLKKWFTRKHDGGFSARALKQEAISNKYEGASDRKLDGDEFLQRYGWGLAVKVWNSESVANFTTANVASARDEDVSSVDLMASVLDGDS